MSPLTFIRWFTNLLEYINIFLSIFPRRRTIRSAHVSPGHFQKNPRITHN